MNIIGMDLGTSSTYLYTVQLPEDASSRAVEPVPVLIPDISDDGGSIATVVMYENGKPYLVGNIAESEFYSNLEAQPNRQLASQFKPEISQAEEGAMRHMRDFLALLRQALAERLDEASRLYVGMPSLAKEDYRLNLAACLREAGWPEPEFVRESDAALVSCLQSGTIDINDIGRKCLILDFGGGTCDYTSVENMDILQYGGDLLYGGRLFDDLFYQVFCRHNPDFASQVPSSPYAWYVHWIECKSQKEKFSDFTRGQGETPDLGQAFSLHALWYDSEGERHDAWVHDYSCETFIRDAENYSASPEMLALLAPYINRGGLSASARDLVEGRRIALISWLQELLAPISNNPAVMRVIITGGSSRWYFVPQIIGRLFASALCLPSNRSYEDIAFGLAMFPLLLNSRKRVKKLLDDRLQEFTARAVATTREIIIGRTDRIISQCSEQIVKRDIMPVLEKAQTVKMTVGELESAFAQNIRDDSRLLEIVREQSTALREQVQRDLNYAIKNWLKENGVLLVPNFVFSAESIGSDFFDKISVKILRMDSLNLMHFTLTTVIPVLAATAVATVVAHTGEPVMTMFSGGLTFGATWFMAKTAPKYIANRALPKFFLTEKSRQKIAEKNRVYIEKVLRESLKEAESRLLANLETGIRTVLESMLARLSVLNQISTH